MTHILEFSPAVEEVLAEKAARRGVKVDELVVEIVEQEIATPPTDPVLAIVEWQRAHRAGSMASYIADVEAFRAGLHAKGFSGVDGAEAIRTMREERADSLAGRGTDHE